MRSVPVVLSLGSNLGDRGLHIRRAIAALDDAIRVVRLSSMWETEPVDAREDSQPYLNAVIAGYTKLSPEALLDSVATIERSQGRRRRHRNESRPIDIDVVLFGSRVIRRRSLTIPHPRYRERAFVTEPLRELTLPWAEPADGRPISRFSGAGRVEKMKGVLAP